MAEIRIVCQECQANLKVSNPAAFGKTIACPKCKAPIKVPAAAGPAPAPKAAPPPARPLAPEPPRKTAPGKRTEEEFDDFDEVDEPRRKPARKDEVLQDAPPKKRRDDDFDDRPRGRGRDDYEDDDRDRGRGRRDDDYEEEDRPRAEKKKAGGKSVLDWVVIGVTAVGAIAYVVCLVMTLTGNLIWTPGGDEFKPKSKAPSAPPALASSR